MNVVLWILQVVLSLHTAMGAVWKFSRTPEQTMPSLKAIPHGVWLALGVVELFFALGLILPALSPSLGVAAPLSAGSIAAVMLVYCGLHIRSGAASSGPMVYWLVVAAVSAFIAVGRLVLQ
jgi:hypothetical protein